MQAQYWIDPFCNCEARFPAVCPTDGSAIIFCNQRVQAEFACLVTWKVHRWLLIIMKACARYKPRACAASILSSYEWWPVPALVGHMCSAEKCPDKSGKGSKSTKAHAMLASCHKQLKVHFWTGELQKLQAKPAQGSPRPVKVVSVAMVFCL